MRVRISGYEHCFSPRSHALLAMKCLPKMWRTPHVQPMGTHNDTTCSCAYARAAAVKQRLEISHSSAFVFQGRRTRFVDESGFAICSMALMSLRCVGLV